MLLIVMVENAVDNYVDSSVELKPFKVQA